MTPRNRTIVITNINYEEAKTVYAMLTGTPQARLIDSSGKDFAGRLALTDGLDNEHAYVKLSTTKEPTP